MLVRVGSKWLQVASMLFQMGLKAVQGSILEASWRCQNVKIALKTNVFSTFFKLLAVGFKWLRVGSSWSQVSSSWCQVGLKLRQVGLKFGSSWPKMASC